MRKMFFIWCILVLVVSFTSCNEEIDEPITTPNKTVVENLEEVFYKMNGNDVHILKDGAKLNDMVVNGDLFVDETVGNGEFYLENVRVEGAIYINGGGENSGYLVNVIGKELIIQSKTNPKIVLDMNTSLEGIQIAADCKVHTEGANIKAVTVNSTDTDSAIKVLMKGDLPKVSIESTANITIDGEVSLLSVLKNAGMTNIEMVDQSKVYFYSCYGKSVSIHGGTIVEAWINAEYCSLPDDVEKIGSEVGVAEVTIGDVQYSIPGRPARSEVSEQTNNSNDADSNSKKDESSYDNNNSDEMNDNITNDFALEGYPNVSVSGMAINIAISSYTSGKAYILIEDNIIGSMGSTPLNVRNGDSSGAGTDGYIVIAESFDLNSLLKEYNYTINLESYMPTGGDGPPPEHIGFSGYVFIVIEDNKGNLSKLYQFKV